MASVAPNAVLPAWREAHVTVLAQSQWNLTAGRAGGLARAREMTDVVVPALGRLVAEGAAEDGTYLNEADPGLADWQWQFDGSNWARLAMVRRGLGTPTAVACIRCPRPKGRKRPLLMGGWAGMCGTAYGSTEQK